MKRIVTLLFVALFALLVMPSVTHAVSPSLDQHNHGVFNDSLAYLVGQTTDTSVVIPTGSFSEFTLTGYNDTSSSEDSSDVIVIVQGTLEQLHWTSIDTLDLDETVANLPAFGWSDMDGTLSDWRYARLLSVNQNGANDSSMVVNRLFRKE